MNALQTLQGTWNAPSISGFWCVLSRSAYGGLMHACEDKTAQRNPTTILQPLCQLEALALVQGSNPQRRLIRGAHVDFEDHCWVKGWRCVDGCPKLLNRISLLKRFRSHVISHAQFKCTYMIFSCHHSDRYMPLTSTSCLWGNSGGCSNLSIQVHPSWMCPATPAWC